jgi:hypothetical protein
VTGNVDNVTRNACVNCKHRQLQRRSVCACVELQRLRYLKPVDRVVINGFATKDIVFCKCVGRLMTGIVKILFSTVRTFAASLKCTKNAHQNFLKLQHVENTVLLSLGLALKIRVSAVRFCPRPPFENRSITFSATVFSLPPALSQCAPTLCRLDPQVL